MEGRSVGTVFVELDLDTTKYTKAQNAILAGAKSTSLNVEKNWKIIGEKSDVMYNAMRQNIFNAYDMIKNKAGTTAAEIVRLEQAKNAKLKALDLQQFGSQISLLDKLKAHWLGISAAIAGAMVLMRQAWNLAEMAAEFEEQRGVLNKLATQYGTTADSVIKDIQTMSDGLISMSDIARIATQNIGRGMTPQQFNDLAKAADLMSDTFKDAFGGQAVTAFERMADGITKGRKAFLGLAIEIGIGKDQVEAARTEVERFNLVMNRYAEISATAGEQTDSTNDKMERFLVTIKDLQLWMGTALIRAASGAAAAIYGLTAAFWALDAAIYRIRQAKAWLTDKLGITKGEYVALGLEATNAMLNAEKYTQKASDALIAMTADSKDLAAGMAMLKPPDDAADKVKKIAAAMKEVGPSDEHIKAWEKYVEEWKKIITDELDFYEKLSDEIIDVEYDGLEKSLIQNQRHYDDLRNEARQYITDREALERALTTITQLEADSRLNIERKFAEKAVETHEKVQDQYLKSFEDIHRDLMGGFDDFFYNITDKGKDAFGDLGEWILNYFKRLLAQMATQAIANPIIVPIAQQISQFGGAAGGGMGLAGVGALGLYGGIGAGTSALMGGNSTAGMLGGLAGYGLATSSLMTGGAMASTMISAGLTGAFWGSAIPIVGTLIGAAVGALLGGLGGGGHSPNLQLGTMGTPNQAWTNKFGEGDFTLRKWNELGAKNTETIMQVFETVKEQMKSFMTDMGMDISKLGDEWKSSMADSDSNIKKVIQRWIGEYASFLTGIDFKEFQRSGEEMADTVSRVISAIGGMKTLGENIDTVIEYLNDSTDAFSQFMMALNDFDQQISDVRNTMDSLTDPSDIFDAANQLYGLIVQRYETEIAFVQQLEQSIKNLKMEYARFVSSMNMKIADLGGSPQGLQTAIDMIAKAGLEMANNLMNTDISIEDKMPMLQDFLAYLDEWYNLNLEKIQIIGEAEIEIYEAKIDALEEQQDIIDEQLDALREQYDLAKGWKSVLDSTKAMIFNLKATLANPDDALARLDFVRGEIERVQALFRSSSGEQQMGYGTDLQDLIQQYSQIGQEAYQRPSSEWQAIYNEMIGWLEEIEAVSAEGAKDAEDLLAEISGLEKRSNEIASSIDAWQSKISAANERMETAINALNTEARGYYEWARAAGDGVYAGNIANLETTLNALLGPGGTVASYIERSRGDMVMELEGVKDYLNGILAGLTGYDALANAVPSYAVGTNYVPKTGLAILHQGEKVIPSGKDGGTAITVAPQITINSSGDASPKEIAREVESILISSLKYGKGRIAVQEIQRSRR